MDPVIDDRKKYLLTASLLAVMLQFLKVKGLTPEFCSLIEKHMGVEFANGPVASFLDTMYADLHMAIEETSGKVPNVYN